MSDLPTNIGGTTRSDDPILKHSELHNATSRAVNANTAAIAANTTTIAGKADKTYVDSQDSANATAIAGKYTKPGTGIPKTDLDTATQTSLGKADSALQSAPVISVNTKTGAVVLTPDDLSDASSTNKFTTAADKAKLAAQSGTNTGDETAATIKTKLGITTISGANTGDQDLSGLATKTYVDTADGTKQATLVSGTNIKTVNGTSLLGAGDIAIAGGTGSDATTTAKGIIQLAGDLAGTAAAPTVPGLAGKEPAITAGTSAQYYRGDKTMQTLNQDAVPSGTTNKAYTATEQTKLAGIATGATANSTDATLLARANHTGTESADVITDGTTNKAFLATERTKLTGIATGATANSTDATLLNRANHTGTQAESTVTNLVTDLAAKAPLASPTFTGTVVTPAIQVTGGVIAAGKVLTADASGNATWQTAPGAGAGSGDMTKAVYDPANKNAQLAADSEVVKLAGSTMSGALTSPALKVNVPSGNPEFVLQVGAVTQFKVFYDATNNLVAFQTPSTFNFGGSVLPQSTAAYALGSALLYWTSLFASRLNLNSTAFIDGATAGVAALTGTLNVSGSTMLGSTSLAPTHTLTLPSTATGIALYNTSDQTTNYERLRMNWSGNIFNIQIENGGTGIARTLDFNGGSGSHFQLGTTPAFKFFRNSTTTATLLEVTTTGLTNASGSQTGILVDPTILQTGTAGYTALLINPTETTVGSGAKLLADFQVGGVSKVSIDNGGGMNIGGSILSRNINPASNNAYNVGNSTTYFNNVYASRLNLNATAYLDGATAGIVAVTGRLTAVGATIAGADFLYNSSGNSSLVKFDYTNNVVVFGPSAWDSWSKYQFRGGGASFDDDFRFAKAAGDQNIARMGGAGFNLVFAPNNGSLESFRMNGDGTTYINNSAGNGNVSILANTPTGKVIMPNLQVTGSASFNGSTSGATTLQASGVAGATTVTLPASNTTLVGYNTIDTLSNKNVASATNTFANVITTASSSTPTPTGDSRENELYITALAAGATIAAPTGTPTNGNKLQIRIKDNGTAQTLAFNAAYRAIGLTLPTTTVAGKTMYLGAKYNSTDSVWDVIAYAAQA